MNIFEIPPLERKIAEEMLASPHLRRTELGLLKPLGDALLRNRVAWINIESINRIFQYLGLNAHYDAYYPDSKTENNLNAIERQETDTPGIITE